MKRIAIVGAGLAGITAALRLREHAEVTVYEKSWRAGGRITTRQKAFEFDHGAQHFYAKTDAFKAFLEPLIDQGLVQRWDARFVEYEGANEVARRQWGQSFPHYVAVPGMTALGQTLAKDLPVIYQTRVTDIRAEQGVWRVFGDEQLLGEFDWVILAVPAPQAAALVPDNFAHAQRVKGISMQACYSLMLGLDQALDLDFDAALVRNSKISWISVNNSKPGRAEAYALLVHSSNQWADEHLDLSREAVIAALTEETEKIVQANLGSASYVDLHRWLYANIVRQTGDPALVDQANRLAAIGDWCISGRIESAFTSAMALEPASF